MIITFVNINFSFVVGAYSAFFSLHSGGAHGTRQDNANTLALVLFRHGERAQASVTRAMLGSKIASDEKPRLDGCCVATNFQQQ